MASTQRTEYIAKFQLGWARANAPESFESSSICSSAEEAWQDAYRSSYGNLQSIKDVTIMRRVVLETEWEVVPE